MIDETEYATEARKVLNELADRNVMVLATSANDLVSARSMSTVLYDGKIYFQTDKSMEKYQQIVVNRNVALSINNIQIQGAATDVGTWDKNQKVLEEYKKKHLGSYETYGTQPSQTVVEVTIKNLKKWEYVEGKPFIFVIDFDKKTTTRRRYFVDESST